MRKIEITEKERKGLKAVLNALAEINTACIDLKFEKHSWNENGKSYLAHATSNLTAVLENINRDMLDSLEGE